LKAQELNPDQQAGSMKVEPDAGGQEDWNNFNVGSLLT
jgi:hypothetical protein